MPSASVACPWHLRARAYAYICVYIHDRTNVTMCVSASNRARAHTHRDYSQAVVVVAALAMSSKKRAAPGAGVPRKKSKKDEPSHPEPGLDHPTHIFVQTCIMEPLRDELLDLASQTPLDYAGICAFSGAKFKANMQQFGEYECNVLASSHRLGEFEHAHVLPPIGCITRLSRTHFFD